MEINHYPSHSLGMGHVAGVSTFNMGQMANMLPDYRSQNYGTHSYQQGFPVPPTTTPPTMYQYPQNSQFAGQTRLQYDSSFAQQYPDAFLQSQQGRASYAPPSEYQVTHVQGQQQFTTQPYYPPEQQSAQNYSAPYTQLHQPYASLNATFNPYSQGYGSRNHPNQVSGQVRQGTNYFFGPGVQTGGEALFAGTVPAGGSYAQPSGPGRLLRYLSCS
jgi:hypothetical protein